MHLGALVDLGVDATFLEAELRKLNIPGFHLEVGRDKRRGISGTKVSVVVEDPDNEKHRHLRHIEELITASSLSQSVKDRALGIFIKVAEAEAKVHGIDIQKVHFHEVGALDSIADIVGAAICQEALEVDAIWSTAIELGGGTVKCAHGLMPVPAPATAEIVAGLPVRYKGTPHEATTPTGAAILAATVDRFVDATALKVSRSAYGIGQRDTELPNVLRVFLGEVEEAAADGTTLESGVQDMVTEKACLLECNLDDMNPEHFSHLFDRFLDAGADDVTASPIQMKKGRPAQKLSVLCSPDKVEAMRELFFRETPTLGIRETEIRKHMLRREFVKVETRYGSVDVKRSWFKGEVVREKAEYEQCRRLAESHGVRMQEVEREVYKKL